MGKRVAFYTRVNTDGQTTVNQQQELEEAARRHGWTIVEVFADRGISGARCREKRPAFDRLGKAIARREIDMAAAWSVDRLGRSLQDLVAFLGELKGKGVYLYLHRQGLEPNINRCLCSVRQEPCLALLGRLRI